MKLILSLLLISSFISADVTSWILSGDRVEKDYLSYTESLKSFHQRLEARIKKEAPEILRKLASAPEPLQPGYQKLPRVREEELNPPKKPNEPTFSASTFSWKKTRDRLFEQSVQLLESEKLLALKKAPLDQLTDTYRSMESNQKLIGSWVQYNRLWQNEIVLYRERYDENTRIYDQLISKKMDSAQAVQDVLKNLFSTRGKYFRVRKKSEKHLALEVTLLSDIEDDEFLSKFVKAVNKYWRVEGEVKYEVDLKIKKISAAELYKGEVPPKFGEIIDVSKHVARFPAGEMPLTTGAGTTHYFVGDKPYLVMGSEDTSDTILAHEFGHVLSLPDAYFRGYRNAGTDGFEILEIVPDLTDIMSAPGVGRVKKHHFDLIVEAAQKP